MHADIMECAEKAGISNIHTRNYPLDERQRGATYWAGMLGALSVVLSQRDKNAIAYERKIGELEGELRRIQRELAQEKTKRTVLASSKFCFDNRLSSDQEHELKALLK